MEYREFLVQIEKKVQEKAGKAARVTISETLKNNKNPAHQITLFSPGTNVSPAIGLEICYKQYCSGASIDAVAEYILEQYEKCDRKGTADVSFYTDFTRVKHRLVCKLVNYEKNKYMLHQVPHRTFHDLAIVYYCRTEHSILGKGSILVLNDHLRLWQADTDQIHEAAFFNTLNILPYRCYSITDMIEEIVAHDSAKDCIEEEHPVSAVISEREAPMYVLTNSEKYWGAVSMIYDSVLSEIAQRLGQDFFVLPSSVHECMIIPVQKGIQAEELREMVIEINRNCVKEEEILGDSVYQYSRNKKYLELVCGAEMDQKV